MNLGTGLSNRPGTDPGSATEPAPAVPASGRRAWLEANRRAVVLLAVTVPLAAAGAGYLLLFAGTDPVTGTGTGPAPGATAAAPAPTPTQAPASGPASASASKGGSAGSSRNPFAPRPSASSAASGSASGSTSGSTSGSASASASATASTVTATVVDPAVYLTLFSIAADGKATFSVNGTGYTQSPGDAFGEGKALTYHKTVTVSGTRCASVSYQDQTDTVCPGEMHQVG